MVLVLSLGIGNHKMILSVRALAALCVAASCVRAGSDSNPVINLGYASYRGVYNSTSEFVRSLLGGLDVC